MLLGDDHNVYGPMWAGVMECEGSRRLVDDSNLRRAGQHLIAIEIFAHEQSILRSNLSTEAHHALHGYLD